MSLAVTRERRENAGSKISSLLESEEKTDHFYDNLYGGFNEEDNDTDYHSNESDSEDSVDSDFSIDENDEHLSDDQNDEELNQKPKTKIKSSFDRKYKSKQTAKEFRNFAKSEVIVPLEVDLPLEPPLLSESISKSFANNSFGEQIIEKRLKFVENENLPQNKTKIKNKSKELVEELSQKELLKEAVITEKKNLKSLKEWQELESKRAMKTKVDKHSVKGSFIRFQSLSMPIIQESDNESTDKTPISQTLKRSHNSGAESYSRTFLTFSDDKTYESLLKSLSNSGSKALNVGPKAVCAVSQMPARYFDPISELPFADKQAFNTIRDLYYNNLEKLYANMDNKEIKQWIEWRANFSQKWTEWHRMHSYNKSTPSEAINDSNLSQSEPYIPKVQTIDRVSRRSGRKLKKY